MKKSCNWEEVDCTGGLPSAIFGHTTTLVGKTKVILFGGVIDTNGKMGMSNSLHIYSVYNNQWVKVERTFC